MATYEQVPIDRVHESPGNPRKTFDAARLDELATSIGKFGVLEPIAIRRTETGDDFVLVFGARRLRAAKLAGYDSIPAKVVDLDDAVALEVQLAENVERDELHPLEEADAYRRLHEDHGRSVDTIAERMHRSRGHVQGRLKLCQLKTAARALFVSGKLTAATALIVARIPDEKQQNQAAQELADGPLGQPMTAQMALQHVERKYMLKLADAPFNTGRDGLAGAPACGACPKRTGNQPDLFSDVKAKDLCTDAVCYGRKAEAWWKEASADAKKNGQRVLSDAESKKLFPYIGSPGQMVGRDYVDMAAKCAEDRKGRTYAELLAGGEADEHAVHARDAAGHIHRLLPSKDVKRLLRDAGFDFRAPVSHAPKDGAAPDRQTKTERALAAADARALDHVREAVIAAVVEQLERKEPSAEQWRALFTRLAASLADLDALALRRGFTKGEANESPEREVEKRAAKMTASQLRALFVEAALVFEDAADLRELAKAFRVDEKQIAGEARAAAEEEKRQIREAAAK